jgi:two-component system cell cycle sensor histidine kinase/response regulator CckA
MQAHHGFIDVQSKQNQGTTFQLFFPASKTDSRRVDLSPQKVVTNLEGKETILFVEDESSIRQVILYTFGLRGYKVFTAQDGISAIQLYEEHKQEIDLVITDLGLPGMTGIDVFKKLKGLNPEVKIIITSGFLEQDIMNILLVAGAKAFIQKPYQPISVLQTVREVLDKKDS